MNAHEDSWKHIRQEHAAGNQNGEIVIPKETGIMAGPLPDSKRLLKE